MTGPNKIDSFKAMIAKNPNNALARFGLANEAAKVGDHLLVVEQLTAYLGMYEDEGFAYLRLGDSLRELGRREEATAAWAKGVEVAELHGHAGMAEEIRGRLEG